MVWLLLLLPVPNPAIVAQVDIAELNHVVCPTNGNEQGVYWVWWRWQTVNGFADYYVVDWVRQTECRRPENGVQTFWSKKRQALIRVESRLFHETWTYYDRESEDRNRLPEARRRKLGDKQTLD